MPLGSVLRQFYYISEQAIENRLHNGFNIARFLNDQIFKLDTPCTAGARSDGLRPYSHVSHTSVRGELAKRCRTRADLEGLFFFNLSTKNANLMVENGSLNRPVPLVNYINSDPLSDHSKSKAQTIKVQQPCHTLQIPLVEINYLAQEKEKNISFSSLPDGKSASRKKSVVRQ